MVDEQLYKDDCTAAVRRNRSSRGFDGKRSGLNSCGDGLLFWEDCPKPLQFNKYIRSGYRAGLTRRQCLCSLFQYHNETGNILVHLLPALMIIIFMTTGSILPWEQAKLAFWEAVIPTLLCLLGSVIYHTFMANHWHYYKYLYLDVCGVFSVLVCGAWSGFYWGMLCHPYAQFSFIFAYYATAIGSAFSVLKATSPIARAAPMLGLLSIRISSVIFRLFSRTSSMKACYLHIAMEVSAIVGAVINISRCPEKWVMPSGKRKIGIFDYWLNSHQIMHLLVLASLLFKFLAVAEDYKFSHSGIDRCAPAYTMT